MRGYVFVTSESGATLIITYGKMFHKLWRTQNSCKQAKITRVMLCTFQLISSYCIHTCTSPPKFSQNSQGKLQVWTQTVGIFTWLFPATSFVRFLSGAGQNQRDVILWLYLKAERAGRMMFKRHDWSYLWAPEEDFILLLILFRVTRHWSLSQLPLGRRGVDSGLVASQTQSWHKETGNLSRSHLHLRAI